MWAAVTLAVALHRLTGSRLARPWPFDVGLLVSCAMFGVVADTAQHLTFWFVAGLGLGWMFMPILNKDPIPQTPSK